MIRNGINAAFAAEQVGYQSPSQFSREFKRLFGRSPAQEVHHLKKLLMVSPPVVAGGKRASLLHQEIASD